MRNTNKLSDLGCGGLFLVVILLISLVFGLMCLEAAIAMWIWNMVIVALFAAPIVSFWQMFCIMILCNILFKAISTSWGSKD